MLHCAICPARSCDKSGECSVSGRRLKPQRDGSASGKRVCLRLYLFMITWASRASPNFCHFNAVVFNVVDRLYSAILRSRADSLRSHVILHERIAFL